MLGLRLYNAAGRAAYLAGFHAAQALISEKTDRSVKTHRGVSAELHRIVQDDLRLDPELRGFLSFAYNLKAEHMPCLMQLAGQQLKHAPPL